MTTLLMSFGLDRCADDTFKRGLYVSLDTNYFIKDFGINKRNGIKHSGMEVKVRKEFCRQIRAVLKTLSFN